jgi:hypothetical protein
MSFLGRIACTITGKCDWSKWIHNKHGTEEYRRCKRCGNTEIRPRAENSEYAPQYDILVDEHVHEDTADVKNPDFTELERALITQRDYAAKKMRIAPEDAKLISVSFVFAHEAPKKRNGRDGKAVAFAAGVTYRDVESRELVEIMEAVMEEYDE